MKLNLLKLGVFACLFSIAVGCSETEVKPNQQATVIEAEVPSPDASAKISDRKVILVPINGTINQIAFTGLFEIYRFSNTGTTVASGGKLYAHGRLRKIQGENLPASITSLMKRELKLPVTRAANSPAARTSAVTPLVTCDVLLLNLAPLDLDVLGLTVHLNQVLLDINAVAGGGNLLGNLLCTVVGLFDGLGALATIVAVLNNIVALIGTIGGA